MKEERNVLLTEAVPQIQEECCKLGLQFQLVDLNWAVEEDMLNEDLCWSSLQQREIAACCQASVGPCFVVGSPISQIKSFLDDEMFPFSLDTGSAR